MHQNAVDAVSPGSLMHFPSHLCLFLQVGNHQTLALDLGVLCEQFLRERQVLLRGLAHPVIFSQSFAPGGSSSSSGSSDTSDGSNASSGGDQGTLRSGVGGGSSTDSSNSSSSGLMAWDPVRAFGSLLSSGGGGGGGAQSQGGGGDSTDGRCAAESSLLTELPAPLPFRLSPSL